MTIHKFRVGQTVHFAPDRYQDHAGRGFLKVTRLLPDSASAPQYRIKSQADGHERIAGEDQLTPPRPRS